MTICPSELHLSMYVDGALAADDVATTAAHVAVCPGCRSRLATLRVEANVLAHALAHETEPAVVPHFKRPISPAAVVTVAAVLVAAAVCTAVPALVGVSLPAPLAWLNPFSAWRFVDVAVDAAIFLAQRGGAIMTSITETVATTVVATIVAWLAFRLRDGRSGPLVICALVCVSVSLPTPAQALEIRHDKDGYVVVPAGETVADTLIAAGENVEIDGNVEGDLIAFGRRVSIRGHVGGQVITAAAVVSIDGEVDGSVLGFGQSLDVSAPRIGRNLYAFATTVQTSPGTRIEHNAIVGARRAEFAGAVGRDVLGFAEEVEVSNSIGGNLHVYADRVTLLAAARVAGGLNAHVPQEDHLTIAPGAVIGGAIQTDVRARHGHENRYTTSEFYAFQVLRFAAAFLTGLVLLTLVPGLRRTSLDSAADALVASGVGLVTLVAAPIIAVIVAITVIGIPLALFGVLLWLAGIYLAKVVLAHYIGARLTAVSGRGRHFAVALALGLLLVILVVNVPLVGGVLNFVLTCCGLGLLVLYVWRAFQGARSLPAERVFG